VLTDWIWHDPHRDVSRQKSDAGTEGSHERNHH
jgi:hypothetical protein